MDDSIPTSIRDDSLTSFWDTTGEVVFALPLAEKAEDQGNALLPIDDDIAREVGGGELNGSFPFDIDEDAVLQIRSILMASPCRRGNGSALRHLTATDGVGIVELNSEVNI